MDKDLRKQHTPFVTVMMPVHNGDKYIRFAIDSILSQVYKDFELLIINDASTDESVKIVNSYQYARIRLVNNSKRLGLSITRQRGVMEARGSLIAFLDSDDIALPSRLEKQVNYLMKNTQVSAVGAWVEVIDGKGRKTGRIWRHATLAAIIPSILLFRNCFTQSSMMVRKKNLLEFGYRQDYWAAPDYDLWSRMIAKYHMANIGEVLTHYRAYEKSMSYTEEAEIKNCTQKIIADNLKRLGLKPTQEEIVIHDSLERYRQEFSIKETDQAQNWLMKLISANQRKQFYSENIFNMVVSDYWFKVCCVSANRGLTIFKKFYSSDLAHCHPEAVAEGSHSTSKLRGGFFTPFRMTSSSNWKKNLILFTLSVLHKSRLIDVTSEIWMKLIH